MTTQCEAGDAHAVLSIGIGQSAYGPREHIESAAELAVKFANESPLILPPGIKLRLHRPETLSDSPSLLSSAGESQS
jgi:hypothetical protein